MEKDRKLVEGYYTVNSIPKLSEETGVKAPILNEIYKIVYEGKHPRKSIEDIMKMEAEKIE